MLATRDQCEGGQLRMLLLGRADRARKVNNGERPKKATRCYKYLIDIQKSYHIDNYDDDIWCSYMQMFWRPHYISSQLQLLS